MHAMRFKRDFATFIKSSKRKFIPLPIRSRFLTRRDLDEGWLISWKKLKFSTSVRYTPCEYCLFDEQRDSGSGRGVILWSEQVVRFLKVIF